MDTTILERIGYVLDDTGLFHPDHGDFTALCPECCSHFLYWSTAKPASDLAWRCKCGFAESFDQAVQRLA